MLQQKNNCSNCPFNKCQAMPVFEYEGPAIDILFVNEWPDTYDIEKNEALAGPKGELLHKAVLKAGGKGLITKAINAVSCIPPKNVQKKKGVWEALDACYADRLLDTITKLKPKVIMGLGPKATGVLTGEKDIKITKVTGHLQEFKVDDYIMRIVPCVKPSSVLHGASNLAYFNKAIEAAIELCDKANLVKIPDTKFVVITPNNVEEFTQRIFNMDIDRFTADVETTGLDYISDEIIVTGFCWKPGRAAIFTPEALETKAAQNLFTSPFMRNVFHNGKFDVQFLAKSNVDMSVHDDTILMHYALNETKGTHDLEQLAITYLGAEPYEHEVKKYLDKEEGYKYCPPEILYPYLARDVDYTYRLYKVFDKMLDDTPPLHDDDPGLRWMYENILKPASSFLTEVERVGLKVDPDKLDAYEAQLFIEKEALWKTIQEEAAEYWDPEAYQEAAKTKKAPEEFNPASWKQLSWLLYTKMGLVPKKMRRNDQGWIKTGEDILSSIESPPPFVTSLLDYRGIAKEHSTYAVGVRHQLRAGGAVRSTYLLYGTVTGRLSSRDPNLQNIPRKGLAKSIFVARKGKRFIEVDYKAAELRVLAVRSGDPTLLTIFKEGRDLHDETATAMFGEGWTQEQRVGAKAINFGIIYGLTAHSLERDLKLEKGEGAEMIRKWYENLPMAEAYLKDRRQAVVEGRTLVTPFGRRRRFGVVTPRLLRGLQNQATNFEIQSTASDLTLLSGIHMLPNIRKLYGGEILNLVHDSILFEFPDDDDIIFKACRYIRNVMRGIPKKMLNTEVPFEIDYKMGYSWGGLKDYQPFQNLE